MSATNHKNTKNVATGIEEVNFKFKFFSFNDIIDI